MFGRIAGWYDFLNHALSLGLDRRWRRKLVDLVRPGPTGRVLDLAAGTLDVSLAVLRRHPQVRVLAMDFSEPMLRKGRGKIPRDDRHRLDTVLADGRRLPLPDRSVDSVTIAFGIRNILPRTVALAEMHRVLAPGGRVCILEFGTGRDRIWGGLYNFYLQRVLPGVGRLVSGDQKAYRYLAETIREFPDAPSLAREMAEAGFAEVFFRPMFSGIVYLHAGQRPAEG